MLQRFKLLNVKCQGCAKTLKKSLLNDFGTVEVDLSVDPREIVLEISDDKIANLKAKCKSLGYPFADEDLDTIENISAKAKSFVSCAIGKMEK